MQHTDPYSKHSSIICNCKSSKIFNEDLAKIWKDLYFAHQNKEAALKYL